MPKKDPCQKQACDIQKCLQANRYVQSMCEDVIREMRRCCETQTPGISITCSGFSKDLKLNESRTT
ncbi:cx9C motif-containing protein 4 [Thalassophryne amazonica]|uniref:cx9C motif-containing protein 4 n=1 Tax=Thalassophryne amazonica TaxID=390379 RepID=UPI001471E270|nr:cx9C motif-containing protein 4 [Thalassophryne amazonica]